MGKVDPLLEAPELPVYLENLWHTFLELSAKRPAGMGISPISYTEIENWSRLFGVRLTPWELETVSLIDSAVMGEWAKQNTPEKKDK